ncbi:MAG: SH3 domain-containing protein [Chloroflexota bacterium]
MAIVLGAVLMVFALPAMAQEPTGVVTAAQLNVRTLPDPVEGIAFTRVFQGQQFPIVGRDANANWFQIRLPDGNVGWVSSAYFRPGNFGSVGVTNEGFPQGRVLSQRLNLREQPTTTARSLGQVSRGQVYRVVGKNADSSWYQLRLPGGVTGWVTARWLFVTQEGSVPVVSNAISGGTAATTANAVTNPGGPSGTVVSSFLNIRTLPDPVEGIAFATASQGDVFAIVGRDANANWFQVQLPDGNVGWVSSAYFRVANFGGVPVTNTDYVQGRVLSQRLNIRLSPSTGARSLGEISRGQVYRVLSRSTNGWYEVRLPDGITGWVFGQYLYVANPEALPIR